MKKSISLKNKSTGKGIKLIKRSIRTPNIRRTASYGGRKSS